MAQGVAREILTPRQVRSTTCASLGVFRLLKSSSFAEFSVAQTRVKRGWPARWMVQPLMMHGGILQGHIGSPQGVLQFRVAGGARDTARSYPYGACCAAASAPSCMPRAHALHRGADDICFSLGSVCRSLVASWMLV